MLLLSLDKLLGIYYLLKIRVDKFFKIRYMLLTKFKKKSAKSLQVFAFLKHKQIILKIQYLYTVVLHFLKTHYVA